MAATDDESNRFEWHRVREYDDLTDGRVRSVTIGHRSLALTRFGDRFGALDNHCPHQGGPARRGVDREGLAALPVARLRLRPAHRHARRPGSPTRPQASRSRCATTASTSGSHPRRHAARTVSDVMVETMVAWGVTHVFGMVGHSNLGFADAMRRQEEAGNLTFIGIRHEGAAAFAASAYGKLTGRPAACFGIAGPGLDQPAHRALRRQGRPRAGARDLRPGAVEGARPRRVPGRRPHRRVRATWPTYSKTVLPDSDHGELMSLALQARPARARGRPPRAPRRGAGAAGDRTRRRPVRSGASPTSRSRPRPRAMDDAVALLGGRPAAGHRSSGTAPASTWTTSSRSPRRSTRRC